MTVAMTTNGPRVRRRPLLKGFIDCTIALGLCIILLPIILVTAIVIRVSSPGPIIFRQTRVGRGGKDFTLFKFRTMRADAEAMLATLQDRNLGGDRLIRIPNDPRITRVGHFLRRTALDELPQLLNVLKGDMSLIGPRPQTPTEVALYDDHERRRLEVLPGISGLWQVTARADPSFAEWVRLDLIYIDNWSPLMDLKIAIATIGVMIGLGRRVRID